MTARTLPQGRLNGAPCPYCTVVAQRPPDGGRAVDGLRAHVLKCHPQLFALWRGSFG